MGFEHCTLPSQRDFTHKAVTLFEDSAVKKWVEDNCRACPACHVIIEREFSGRWFSRRPLRSLSPLAAGREVSRGNFCYKQCSTHRQLTFSRSRAWLLSRLRGLRKHAMHLRHQLLLGQCATATACPA